MSVEDAILLTVIYADIFDYPLTLNEIQRYLVAQRASVEEIYALASKMGLLKQTGNYYHLTGRERLATLREQRRRASAQLWDEAIFYGNILVQIPYIRMLAVTGSLAVSNCDEGDDIDLLVVTAPGRLWMCRAMILAVARIAAHRGVRLCPNYLLTTRSLRFPDQNLYAARELAQMVPFSGLDIYEEIWRQNPWVIDFLPNAAGAPLSPINPANEYSQLPVRRFLEAIFHGGVAGWFERWEMNRKIARLTREQIESSESSFSADFCKGHGNRHQQRIKHTLDERLRTILLETVR